MLGAPLGSSGGLRFLLRPVLDLGAVPPDVPRLVAAVADDVRRGRCHGKSSTSYASLPSLARLFVQEDVAHGGLHVQDVEGWVPEHHQFDVLVFVGEALYADVLEAAVGDGFSHLIQLGAFRRIS